MSDSTLREAQRAFTGLLAKPLVTLAGDSALYRSVQRHHKHVNDSARRLGYRVQNVGRAVRLLRLPVAGQVTAPTAPLEAPTRRVRALACVLAAACEEIEGGVTLQKLSDLTAEITSTTGKRIGPYDPDQLSHRRQLVHAAAVLEEWGVLHRRNISDRVEEWAESRHGIGAGYDVDRDALLLFVSPEVMNQIARHTHSGAGHVDASEEADARNATRTIRMLRALVETPVVLYSDLDPTDAEELRATRGLRVTEANHMVGGHVEARREGLVMLIVDDAVRCPVTVEWPTAAAASWLSLVIADLAGRADGTEPDPVTGVVSLTSAQVDFVVEDFMDWKGEYLSKTFRDDPAAVRAEAERQLVHLGLLRLRPDLSRRVGFDPDDPGDAGGPADPGGEERTGWLLLPVAGRYRDPEVVPPPDAPTRAQPAEQPAEQPAAAAADGAHRPSEDPEETYS